MIEHVHTGLGFALARIEGAEPPAPTWRLLFVDGQAAPDGSLVPGTGSGQLYSFLLDDSAVAILHEQSEGASKIVVPAKPRISVVKSR